MKTTTKKTTKAANKIAKPAPKAKATATTKKAGPEVPAEMRRAIMLRFNQNKRRCSHPTRTPRPFALKPDDVLQLWIKQGGKCAETGEPFKLDKLPAPEWGLNQPFAPSLACIKSERGFVRGNVKLVWTIVASNTKKAEAA